MINVYRNKLKRLKSKQTKQNSNRDNKFETMFKQSSILSERKRSSEKSKAIV